MGITFYRFDLVRLTFASLVFLYHAVVLASVAPGSALETGLAVAAELSIQGFFIVSGALVLGSYERSKGLADYFGKRFRRLYPAYAVIIILPAIAAFLLSAGSSAHIVDIFRYLGANLIFLNFLEPNLPGFFQDQRFGEVNGALWTLKIEVMFYCILPLLALGLKRLHKHWWLGIGGLVFAALIWREAMLALDHPQSPQLARQLPGQMMYFAAGMALWRVWGFAKAQAPILLLIGVAILALSLWQPSLEALRPLGLVAFIAGVAFSPGPSLNAAAWGDISYGVYIVHFPVVQTVVALGVFAAYGAWVGIALSIVLVFAISYLLWWLVEKPALRQDSHYRTVSEKGQTDERIRNDLIGRDASGHRYPNSESA